MDSVSCCKDPVENVDGSSHENCICPICFICNSFIKCAAFFRDGQMDALPSSYQEAASLTPNGAPANTEHETIFSPPRTLACNSDSRSSNLQQDGLVKGLDKREVVLQIDLELRSRSTHIGQELATESDCREGSKNCRLESSLKFSLENREAGDLHDHPLPEDEDVCPTCLEEYIPENPKIITHCSHHFHLSCIYEWMERSETCPVCCQVLLFNETN